MFTAEKIREPKQACPRPYRGELELRNRRARRPMVVSNGYDHGRMLCGGHENRPRQQLFVANQYCGALIADVEDAGTGEIQTRTVASERIPHRKRNRDSLPK